MATVEAQVAHIWRRLGFGPLYSDVVSGMSLGTGPLIDQLMARASVSFTDAMPQGPSQAENDNCRRVLELMAFGPNTRGSTATAATYNPAQERLTWFLQGLLVVGMDVVDLTAMRDHLSFLRTGFTSTYKTVVTNIATRPGMLAYLTGDQNVKDHPNQNFARELCELFTLGRVDPVTGAANYTQDDVVEIARAMTGWRYTPQTGVFLDANRWDSGQKTFLGAARGAAGKTEVVNAIAGHPSWAKYVPARLYYELTGFTADAQTLAQLAYYWGPNGNLSQLMKAIATRPEFLSDACILNKVKSPVERVVAATRLLAWPGLSWEPTLISLLQEMGQHPFYPPNVSGWARGDQWLNTNSLQSWCRIANVMCMRGFNWQGLVVGDINAGVEDLYANASTATAADYIIKRAGLRGVTSPATRNALDAYARGGLWNRVRAAGVINLLLMSPEFLAN